MRAWVVLAAAITLFGLTSAASAQSSTSSGIFSPSSFMSTPSIFSTLMSGSRPSMTPFSGLTSATRLVPAFPSFQFPMTQRNATATQVRYGYQGPTPPPKK